ncbi:J517_1871 family lipoprotein [Acinetobacter calcoaceticus]|uniref:J517_1871 family lipoprotein n=1 Tax=Acinetobacter calcoaceticus TaxID=471 RepID=UPI000FDA7C10|nr:J517_1871 family lipoprotein [Acinetobacter calcoaceticus]
MKKIFALSLFLLLSGCVTPATQMVNNKFSEIQPSTPSVSGVWTVSISPGISTIKLDSDGNGILCDDTSGHVVFNKVKYANNMIYIQNGMTLEVKLLNKDILESRITLSASNSNMVYKADNDLKAASLKCAKEL